MTVRGLPRVKAAEGAQPEPGAAEHPMRLVTRDAAFRADGWSPELAGQVNDLFDQAAPEWHTRSSPERLVPLVDALERGGPFPDGVAVELGSGTGIATPTIVSHFVRLVAVDLSMEMLRLAPPLVPRVRADGARLPFRDCSVATLLLVNMLLFPLEVERVLQADGALVWVNTLGENTPIYLTAEEVDEALPGEWEVTASEAGAGTWCVARRA